MFFAEHFLQMAQCCQTFGAAKEKRVYLDQTKLLALLLFENPDYQQSARDLVEEINKLRAVDVVVTTMNLGPETPKRNNTDQPMFTSFIHGRPSTVVEEYEPNNNNVVEAEIHTQKSMLKNGVSANGEDKKNVEMTAF